MKKLSILLIGLLLVAGLGFAQEVTFSGDATLTWGVDLNEGLQNGFKNEASSALSVKWTFDNAASGSQGFISLTGMSLSLADGAASISDPAVTAGWMFAPVTVTIYSAPTFEGGNAAGFAYLGTEDDDAADEVEVALSNKNVADVVEGFSEEGTFYFEDADDDPEDRPDGAILVDNYADGDLYFVPDSQNGDETDTAFQGVTLGVDLGVATVDLKVASDGTWADSKNSYAIGAVVGAAFGPATVSGEAWWGPYGANGDAADIALSANVGAAFGPASVGLGYDVVVAAGTGFGQANNDLSLSVGVDLGIVSLSSLTYLFNVIDAAKEASDIEIDQQVVVSSSPIDGLSITDTFQMVDLLVGSLSWYNSLSVSYTMGGIMPYVTWGYYSPADNMITPDEGDITAGVSLTGFVENTVFTIEYDVDDVLNDNGALTFAGKISY